MVYFLYEMKLLFALIISLFSLTVFGQQTNGNLVITGIVYDTDTHTPLQFVTITLQDTITKEFTGDITNKKGEFKLSVPKGKYYFIAESLSFSPFIINLLNIDQDIELGVIELNQTFEELNEVEIVAKNKLVDYKFAKKIYNASKDIANIGGNAVTVLENTPSVRVDQQGNITVRGNTATVLVNGRPYGGLKSNADVLSLIPANSIDKVEILTRSAKYEAEGGGGILNIIMKNGKREGYNGTIEIHGGIPDNDGISSFLNLKTSKLNVFSTASFNHTVRIKDTKIDQIFLDDNQDPFGNFNEDRTDNRQRNSVLLNIGSDFYIDDKNTLTTSLLYSSSNKNYDSELYINDYQPIDNLIKSSFRDVDDNTDEQLIEAFASFTTIFDKDEHKLSFNLNYNKNTSNNSTFITDIESFLNSDSNSQRSIKNQFVNNYYFQIDYTLPLKNNALFEAGHRSNFRIYENDFAVSQLNKISQLYEPLLAYSNKIKYDENIFSFYANYSKEYENISFSVGLRTEISKTEISELNNNNKITNNYTDIFPSALLSYTFENNSTLSASYDHFIDRPRINQLNPFDSFTDERFILVGNPYLKPYYTNFLLLEYHVDFEKLSLNTALFYSNSTDRIFNILEKTNNQTEDGFDIYRRIPINNGTLNYTGLELELRYSPTKQIRLIGFISPYYADLSETKENLYDYNDIIYYGRIAALLKFSNTFRFQISHEYQSPKKTAITELGTYQFTNITASKDLFEGKSTLTFKISDVFHKRKAYYESLEANAITNRTAVFDTQYLLSFTYRFNKASKRNSNNRTKDIDKNIFEIQENFK